MNGRLVIGANWKMNQTRAEGNAYVKRLRETLPMFNADLVQAFLLPPFTTLDAIVQATTGYPIEVGAQNVHWDAAGAFTGEVSPLMLKDVGCTIAMIGHSERRFLFGETDKTVRGRVRAAYQHNLTPLLCIGETREERDAERTRDVLQTQLSQALGDIPRHFMSRTLLLYEPRWAIGATESAPLALIQSTHALLRALVSELYGGSLAAETRLIYGGSVTAETLPSILRLPDVDGCGVGRASLDPVNFAQLIQLTEDVAHEKIKYT